MGNRLKYGAMASNVCVDCSVMSSWIRFWNGLGSRHMIRFLTIFKDSILVFHSDLLTTVLS